jgi:diguanylate cyclase (GGDEF)-like protein
MRAVLVANPKGGAGKTTLATNLSGHFANQGKVTTLCDLDRQQSALRWMAFRDPSLPAVTGYYGGNQISLSLPREADWVVVDAPAGLQGYKLTDYIRTVDRVVVPLVPSVFDMAATEDFLNSIRSEIRGQRSRDELRLTQEKVKASEERIRELEMELEKTSDLVRHDQLTGVLNRHGLEEMFSKEVARAQRHDTVLCVALLDIDNFKKLNDSLGHEAGDQALIHLASVCRETLRPQDTIARFGGEEFVILLPETQIADAAQVMSRLQRELTKRFFLHDNEKVLITFSAGVTQMTEQDNQGSVIKRADEAMYEAKQTGKNRVVSR